ncbi:5-azacytidine-induced protein 2 [Myotis davidii]|uniref:5-azacytidine-induced protein 2 n=1 Tax=Myotis davidii TaxID=225400 RepID=L5MH72_MYODS|nr:5-azacytidine-induced protein 2 [Myotis davidii]
MVQSGWGGASSRCKQGQHCQQVRVVAAALIAPQEQGEVEKPSEAIGAGSCHSYLLTALSDWGWHQAPAASEHNSGGEVTLNLTTKVDVKTVMDTLVEDDICILNHEKAHRRDTVTPVSIYSDESVASHFALVTAYEDIKKRLKDSEKENSFLKKRIRFLEEKLTGALLDEETSSVGREQVNKAYHAYREVCIDRDNLKSKLDKMNKDNSESLKVLNEQLQSKEVELLQLRTEVETQQVIRNLNPPSSNWEVEKLSCDLKIHGLEQELELMKKECNNLRIELQKAKQTDPSQEDNLQSRDLQRLSISSDDVQNVYWELKREMSNLHLVTITRAQCTNSCTLKGTVGCKAVVGTGMGLDPSSTPPPGSYCCSPAALLPPPPLPCADGAGPTHTCLWCGVIGAGSSSGWERGWCGLWV